MAVTPVAPKVVSRFPNQPIQAGTLQFTFTTPTASPDGFTVPATGREIVILQNTTGGALTVTITGARDPYGFVSDLTTYSLAASEFIVLPAGMVNLYAISSGLITIQVSGVGIKCAVLQLPNNI